MSIWDGFRAAVGFLTRLPAGRAGGADLTGAAGFFPLVGAIVAAAGLGVWLAAEPLLGPLAAAAAAVLATVALTGAVHEDGLADTVDGLWGGATPQRRLEIMRDSRLGTYGAVALAGDLLLRTALLAPLEPAGVARVLLAGHVIGRAAPLVLAAWLPPARPDGQGARLRRVGRGGALLAAATAAAAAVAAASWWAPVVLGAAGLAVAALGRAARRRLGGVTGDVLGAGVQVAGLAAAAATAATLGYGGRPWGG
jgi:adenosylcobinamide-GDP ribazoletransferase